jgi:hypothetical protein
MAILLVSAKGTVSSLYKKPVLYCTYLQFSQKLTMDFNFKSQYFGVTENAVLFLRGGLAYRTIKGEELKR